PLQCPGVELAEERTPCLRGGIEGFPSGALGLPLCPLLLGDLRWRPRGLGPRVACGVGADGDDLDGGADGGGVAGLGDVSLLVDAVQVDERPGLLACQEADWGKSKTVMPLD